jgi:DNA-binding beta-propeller fold protein YncE
VADARGVQLFDLVTCRRVGKRIAMPKRARVSPPPPKPGWVWGPDQAYRVVADGRRLWIAGELTLYRADAARHVIDRTISVFRTDRVGTTTRRAPIDLFSFAPSGGSLWAANLSDGDTFLFEIDARSGKVKRRRPADSEIVGMVAGAGWIWAISHDAATVLRIDPRSGAFDRTRVTSDPHGIAFGAGYVWVALYHESTILRLDPRTASVVGQPIAVPFPPEPMAAGDGRLWAIPSTGGFLADSSRHDVLEIDPERGVIEARFRTRGRPRALAVAADAAWIATSRPNELVRIGPS